MQRSTAKTKGRSSILLTAGPKLREGASSIFCVILGRTASFARWLKSKGKRSACPHSLSSPTSLCPRITTSGQRT